MYGPSIRTSERRIVSPAARLAVIGDCQDPYAAVSTVNDGISSQNVELLLRWLDRRALAQRYFDVFAKVSLDRIVVKGFLVVEIWKLMFLSSGLRIPIRWQVAMHEGLAAVPYVEIGKDQVLGQGIVVSPRCGRLSSLQRSTSIFHALCRSEGKLQAMGEDQLVGPKLQ